MICIRINPSDTSTLFIGETPRAITQSPLSLQHYKEGGLPIFTSSRSVRKYALIIEICAKILGVLKKTRVYILCTSLCL